MKRHLWKRTLRRMAALFFAVIALWLLSLTCDFGAACLRLGENSAFVLSALRTELGDGVLREEGWESLNFWQQMALGQSALLRAGIDQTILAQDEEEVEVDPEPSATANIPATQEDLSEPQLPETTVAPESIQERTILGSDSEADLSTLGVSLFNYTNKEMDLQALASAQVGVALGEGPQILIMHTHGSEAYTMDGTDVYEESDSSRTIDERYNVIRVGDEMQGVFESMGLQVVHDRTLYDYPQYSGAYTRSAQAVESWLEQYPSIQIVLDVHRDALVADDGTVYKTMAEINGEKTAQVLIIVGTDELAEHPTWLDNLALAIRFQQAMNAQWPSLARPITLRSSRFNQQLTHGSLLIEVGSHGNTLQEALRAANLFAQSAGQALLELKSG